MKRMYGIIVFLLLIFLPVTAFSSDGSTIIKKQIDVTEDLIKGLTDAKSADDVAKTFDSFTESMKKLFPELKKFQKKYPELKEGKVPDEMKAEAEKLKEVSGKMSGAMQNIMQYMMDPKVQAAMTRMGEEMSKLDQ